MYIYIIYTYIIYSTRASFRVWGCAPKFNLSYTHPCTQRPVPRALYVYIYIARLISEKTRKWPEKKIFHNIFFFFYGKHFCSEGAEKLVHVHASTYPGRPAPTFFRCDYFDYCTFRWLCSKKSDMVKFSGDAYFDMLFQGKRSP